MTLIEMREKAIAARNEARKILEAAKVENRDMNEAEQARFDAAVAESDRWKKLIADEERLGADEPEDGWKPVENRGDSRTGPKADRPAPENRGDPKTIKAKTWNGFDRRVEEVEYREDDPRYKFATREYDREYRDWLGGRTERRSVMNITQGDKGGLWASEQIAARFFQKVDDALWFRQIADNIDVVGAGSLGIYGIDTDPSDGEWTTEFSTTDVATDTAMKAGKRELRPHNLVKTIKISRTMLRAVPNAENIIVDRLAYRVAVAEEKAFIAGTGSNQPLGVFTANNAGVSTASDVNLGSTTDFTENGLMALHHGLKAQYRRRASYLMHRDAIMRIRRLKVTSTGTNFLWVPGFGGEPDTLLGRPVYESEFAPNTFSSAQYVAVFGDFSRYQIATRVRLEMLRDEYTAAGQGSIRYFVYHESDGMPILGEAFARGKLSN